MSKESKRNLQLQVVPIFDKDGNKIGEKNIFHKKKFNYPAFANLKEIWRSWCKTANPNSKRQKILRGE